jgi:DNA-binding beta-propeller fold protein YncE
MVTNLNWKLRAGFVLASLSIILLATVTPTLGGGSGLVVPAKDQSTNSPVSSAPLDSRLGEVVGDVKVGYNAAGVAYDSGNGYIYVVSQGSLQGQPQNGTVSVISGTTVVANVTVGIDPYGIAYDSGNGYVYVTDNRYFETLSGSYNLGGSVSVISGSTVVAKVPIGLGNGCSGSVGVGQCNGVAYDSADGYVYVADEIANNVTVISGTHIVANIAEGCASLSGGVCHENGPTGVAYDTKDEYVYVTNEVGGNVAIISGTKVVATIGGLSFPKGITYDSGNGTIYVVGCLCSSNQDVVTIINGTMIEATVVINGTTALSDAVYDSGNGHVYIMDGGQNTVTVFSWTTAIAAVPVGGTFPYTSNGGAYDNGNGNLYLVNGTDTVAVISTTLPVLLVHGIASNAVGAWEDTFNFAQHLRDQGFNVWLFDYGGKVPFLIDNEGVTFDASNSSWAEYQYALTCPVAPVCYQGRTLGPIPAYALALSDAVSIMIQKTEASKINIVAHSMGGLVSRWYLQEDGGNARVQKLIMLGTPNQGTPLASTPFLLGAIMGTLLAGPFGTSVGKILAGLITPTSVAEMTVNSPIINALNTGDASTIWSGQAPQMIAPTVDYFTAIGTVPGGTLSTTDPGTTDIKLEQTLSLLMPSAKGIDDGLVPAPDAKIYNPAVISADFPLGHVQLHDDLSVLTQVVTWLHDDPVISTANAPTSNIIEYPTPEAPRVFNSISSGQTETYNIVVSFANSTVFGLVWDKGVLSMTLTMPNGTIVNPSYTGATYLSDSKIAVYEIDNPTPGSWQAQITTSQDSNYTLTTLLPGSLSLSLRLDKVIKPGDNQVIDTALRSASDAVNGATVSTTISTPEGLRSSFSLTDASNNGTYSGNYVQTSEPGYYLVSVNASGVIGGQQFVRSVVSGFTSFSFLPAFDYSLASEGSVSVVQGGSGNVTITATLTAGTGQPVTLSCVSSSLPSGVTCGSFNTNPVTPSSSGATSRLTVGVGSPVATGHYSFQVTGSPLGATTSQTTVSLVVTSPATTGMLRILVSGSNGPFSGATVTITSGPNGQTLPAPATTGTDGSVTFANLAAGTYTCKVTASGYEDKQVTATVIAGQTQSSQASLVQVQQAPSQPSTDYTLYAGVGAVVLVVLLGVFLALRPRRVTPKRS